MTGDTPHKHWPGEWAKQSALMLTWPHPDTDWAPLLEQVIPTYRAIAKAVVQRQQLLLVCHDPATQEQAKQALADIEPRQRIIWAIAPCNDTWARDHGPITVMQNGQPTLLDFTFNGWGNKFDSSLDNRITRTLHAQGLFADAHRYDPAFVLEGGAIESDGKGTLLGTQQCLMNPNRNGAISQAQVEAMLSDTLGVTRFLWLTQGYLAGDDTDSHIDTLARFCDADTLCYVACEHEDDEHYAALKAMEAEIQAFRRADGSPYRLFPLPLPSPLYNADGERLPATYANFSIINGAVLVPVYEVAEDDTALAVFHDCFPAHDIVPIPCRSLIQQFGSLHCITMQLPEGVVPEPPRHADVPGALT